MQGYTIFAKEKLKKLKFVKEKDTKKPQVLVSFFSFS